MKGAIKGDAHLLRPSVNGGGFGPIRSFRDGIARGRDCHGLGYRSRRFGTRPQRRVNRGLVQCCLHGKNRTGSNMRSNGRGGWQCLPTSKCRLE